MCKVYSTIECGTLWVGASWGMYMSNLVCVFLIAQDKSMLAVSEVDHFG